MDFTYLGRYYTKLLSYLKKEGYAQSYIRKVEYDILWILKNEKEKQWSSYVDIYKDRVSQSTSEGHKKTKRIIFGAIQQFDIHNEYPDRIAKSRLIKKGAYHQLVPEFKELIDFYKRTDRLRDLKENSIAGNASGAASFLNAMQKNGLTSLSVISEDDVLSYFLDENGIVSKSSACKKQITAVFKAGVNWKEAECLAILAYLPKVRKRRKNVQFLTPEEIILIHTLLGDESSGLSMRDKAIGKLLFFTGMRACDIANMEYHAINWKADEICIQQQKTNVPLVLPLTAVVGNAVLDYITYERPNSDNAHLFLSELYPHYHIKACTAGAISKKIYKKAGVRQGNSDRRGARLLRYNVATSLLGSGIPRPVISQTLGHANPNSLEPYLQADILHLRECALSIETFPINEGVFGI